MSYKIIEFNEKTGQVILQIDGSTNHVVDLPIDENNNVLTGIELDQYLKGFVPTWKFQRDKKLKIGIKNANEIYKLVTPIQEIPKAIEFYAAEVRNQRNILLASSDWTQLADTKLSDLEKKAWTEYRQALRDLSNQDGFPLNVIYPMPINEDAA
jgi:hypothetical protein